MTEDKTSMSSIVASYLEPWLRGPGACGFKRSLLAVKGCTTFSYRRSESKTQWRKDRLTLVSLCRAEEEGEGLSMALQAEYNTIFE